MWPDGGYAPFRGEKGTTWEGGVRVPLLVKWPGKIPAGSVVQRHPEPRRRVRHAGRGGRHAGPQGELLKGNKMGGTTYKVHLDGYNNLDHWTGKSDKSARREIFYYDETDLMAVRVDAWKMHIGVKHEGQLVEREVLSERAVPLQPADGSDGEDGPGVARVGLRRPQVLRAEDVGADRRRVRSSPRT